MDFDPDSLKGDELAAAIAALYEQAARRPSVQLPQDVTVPDAEAGEAQQEPRDVPDIDESLIERIGVEASGAVEEPKRLDDVVLPELAMPKEPADRTNVEDVLMFARELAEGVKRGYQEIGLAIGRLVAEWNRLAETPKDAARAEDPQELRTLLRQIVQAVNDLARVPESQPAAAGSDATAVRLVAERLNDVLLYLRESERLAETQTVPPTGDYGFARFKRDLTEALETGKADAEASVEQAKRDFEEALGMVAMPTVTAEGATVVQSGNSIGISIDGPTDPPTLLGDGVQYMHAWVDWTTTAGDGYYYADGYACSDMSGLTADELAAIWAVDSAADSYPDVTGVLKVRTYLGKSNDRDPVQPNVRGRLWAVGVTSTSITEGTIVGYCLDDAGAASAFGAFSDARLRSKRRYYPTSSSSSNPTDEIPLGWAMSDGQQHCPRCGTLKLGAAACSKCGSTLAAVTTSDMRGRFIVGFGVGGYQGDTGWPTGACCWCAGNGPGIQGAIGDYDGIGDKGGSAWHGMGTYTWDAGGTTANNHPDHLNHVHGEPGVTVDVGTAGDVSAYVGQYHTIELVPQTFRHGGIFNTWPVGITDPEVHAAIDTENRPAYIVECMIERIS